MKYASEATGLLTSIHQWKPVPPDRFATLLHYHSTIVANEHGHDAISTTALILDRDTTATIWYRAKTRGDCVSGPVLITLEGPSGKTICFEAITPTFEVEPKPAVEVIRDFQAWATAHRRARLKEVALKALSPAPGLRTLVITINEDGRRVCDDALSQIATSSQAPRIQHAFVQQVGGIVCPDPDILDGRKGMFSGVWIHDAGHMGQGVLNALTREVARLQQGEGWLGFTGTMPMGWASPEGLPKERV